MIWPILSLKTFHTIGLDWMEHGKGMMCSEECTCTRGHNVVIKFVYEKAAS
jgi:hypothetical protein